MNIENINRIMGSQLWKKMLHNENYLDYIILDTERKHQRQRGQFFCLLIFFKAKINEHTLMKYREAGARLSTGEGLDMYQPYRFYGTVKLLRFS